MNKEKLNNETPDTNLNKLLRTEKKKGKKQRIGKKKGKIFSLNKRVNKQILKWSWQTMKHNDVSPLLAM
jgi:hypothetical protein